MYVLLTMPKNTSKDHCIHFLVLQQQITTNFRPKNIMRLLSYSSRDQKSKMVLLCLNEGVIKTTSLLGVLGSLSWSFQASRDRLHSLALGPLSPSSKAVVVGWVLLMLNHLILTLSFLSPLVRALVIVLGAPRWSSIIFWLAIISTLCYVI